MNILSIRKSFPLLAFKTPLIKAIRVDLPEPDLTWKKLLNRLKKDSGFLNDNFYLDCLKKL